MTTKRLRYPLVLVGVLIAAGFLTFSLFIAVGRSRALAGGAIEGTVTYYGSLPDPQTIQLSVYTTTLQPLPAPVATAQTTSEERAYTLSGLDDGTYYVFAYLDIDDGSDYDPGDEPFAWYDYEGDGRADPVIVQGGTVNDIDILLTDLWRPLGGPLGQVNALAAGPGLLYAVVGSPHGGANTRIYTSTDKALTWTPVYTRTDQTIRALAFSGTVAYAAGEGVTARGLILKSEDRGVGWAEVFSGTGQTSGVFRAVAVQPLTPSVALAAGWEIAPPDYARVGVAYRTTNGGTDWTRVLTVPEGDLLALAPHPVTPTLVYAGGYYKEGSSQIAAVYRSTDGGAGWSAVLTATQGPSQQFTALAVHPLTPTLIYAGSQTPKYVYRSTDGGDSWSEVLYDRGYRLALDPPTTVYAGDDWRELARSTDGGLTGTWTLRVGDLTPGIIEALAVDPSSVPGALYLGLRDNGIYTSADGGLTWSAGNGGITATTAPVDIALDPQNRTRLFVATGSDGGWRTVDGGRTWERQIWSPTHAFAVHPQDSSVVYAATAAGVLRSEDGGETFGPSYTGAVDAHALAIANADPDVVYAGGEGGGDALLVRSGDGGASWSAAVTLTEGTVEALAVHPLTESVAYAGVEDRSTLPSTAALYRTTDGGAGWTAVYTGGFGAVHAIAIDPEQPDVLYATDDRQVLKSSDGGDTWMEVQSYAESNRNLLAVDPRMGDHLYLAGPGYIAESLDGGQSWSDWTAPINQGTEGRSATALAVDGGGITQTLYAGFDGVWAYDRPAPQSSDFTTERVLGDLSQPTAVDWAPDGRMFIAHQDGRVLVYDDGALTTFVDISDEVNNNWNRGLIGIEIHPSFPVSPYVYLLYTYDPPELPGPDSAVDGRDGNGARVSRLLRVTADTQQGYNVALPGSERVILGSRSTITHTGNPASAGGEDWNNPACTRPDGTPVTDCLPSEGPSHSVGWLEFGHDGSLFVTNGEGAPYINPDPRAVRSQDLDSLGGKVLRIDPETGEGLPDNPFYDGDPASNRSRVWALGLRNPFRFALHPVSDTLYVGDVGWYSWEELNTGRALNFGWPCYEGGASGNVRHSLYEPYTGTEEVCAPLYAQEPDNDVAAPRYAYQNLQGAAIVAGDFYTGTRYPATYRGALFIADYDKRWIKYLTFDGEGDATAHDFLESVSELGGPVQLTLGPDGYLYYVALNPDPSGPSEIRRVLYTSAPSVQVEASPLYGYPPLTVHFTGSLSTHSEQALNYAWTFGDGGSSTQESPTHTYTLSGTYTAALTVTTPQGRSSSDRVRIVVGDSPPTPLILTPTAGSAYTMGTALTFRGQATDVEDAGGGPLPAANLQWNARIFYNGHFHPDFYKATGVSSGTLQVPLHNDNTTLFVCLTAVDSQDLQATTCVELQPRTAIYTFDTDPSGLRLSYDGSSYVTPFTIEMMVNAPRSIAAPLQQNGLTFIGWSDGGRASHEIVGQPLPQMLLATYRIRTWLPLVLREG
jgi:glucose/arabinose dehydrogenase/photosystem II stability/assembly factor-like uncharacterized protein